MNIKSLSLKQKIAISAALIGLVFSLIAFFSQTIAFAGEYGIGISSCCTNMALIIISLLYVIASLPITWILFIVKIKSFIIGNLILFTSGIITFYFVGLGIGYLIEKIKLKHKEKIKSK